jgi:tetratricopeptide (TPR) repeat protein
LNYYLFVVSESPKRLEGKLDRVGFRIATIHFLKKNFSACLPVLKDFHKKYRDSPLMEQAIPLYYLAASNHYGQARDQNAYRQFIEAAGVYVTQCRGNCPELSEARFHLGQHYEKTGAFEQAVKEFSRVGKDSPHFAVANYHVLKHYVKQLEDIKRAGRFPSEESQRIFRESLKGVQKEQDLTLNKKQTSALKSLAPHMAVLLAKRLTFDETPPNEEILARLRLFETLYPKEEMLFPEVFQLRVHCYFNLDQTEPMRKEISDFASSKPITKVRYDALKNLARDFYLQSKAGENGGQTEASEKSARAALLIYQQLYSLSLNHPDFRDHCDALQLRMAQIHIDNNQLDSAEVLYREILNRNSLSADAFYSLGLLYEKKEQWEDALATWRQFSDGVKEGTFHWYESRYKIARAHMKLGHSQKACEILTITLVLHPDLGNDTLAGQYQDLKNDVCQGGS